VLTVDRVWATVGSINFDNRSFALNDELNLSVSDPATVAVLDQHFRDDLETARELDLDTWRRRPVSARAREYAGATIRREL
jgi:cardiolipin synthase